MPHYDKEDPITGYIAFERVLDRLLEEAREAHVMREKIGDLSGDNRSLTQRLAQVEPAAREAAEAAEPIRKLFEAAEALAKAASAVKRPPSGLALSILKMQDALRGAIPHVDLIPF